MLRDRTYWLIGASEGLGRALAKALDAEGCRLILSARSEDRLRELAGELQAARVLPLDVTDDEAVRAAVEEAGDIDGLIYSAGAYEPMPATEWDVPASLLMTDVNYKGAQRVIGYALPGMIDRNRGHIVVIGSISGWRGLPGAVGYGASKAALMHLAENLYMDLKGTNIRVQQANPGFIRTRLTDKNEFNMPMIMDPDEAAAQVVKAMTSRRFATSFPGPMAWFFRLGARLPISWFRKIMNRG